MPGVNREGGRGDAVGGEGGDGDAVRGDGGLGSESRGLGWNCKFCLDIKLWGEMGEDVMWLGSSDARSRALLHG